MSKKDKDIEDSDFLDIDKNLLDDEWLGQPKLYFRWAVQLEDAKEDLDEAKRTLDVEKTEFERAKASIDLDIRKKPDEYKLPKVTDKSILAVMLLQSEYQDAQEEFFVVQKEVDVAKHRVGILQAAVTSLDHRKKALEKLVDLHGQKYFASPRASEGSKEAIEKVEKRSARQRAKGKRSGR